MADGTDRAHVRLAELVAALSLGIDLGFGQPMEHVLRQCLIALRLAERLGLDEQRRAAVYYTALLVNVGCHSDAHEQAKWFGDDIALKSSKYDYEFRSVAGGGGRDAAARARATRRCIGFGSGSSSRSPGHREVDDMIAHHAALARTLGEQLGLPEEVLDALGGAYETWDGQRLAGRAEGRARSRSPRGSRSSPSSSRSRTASAASMRRRTLARGAPASSSTRSRRAALRATPS